MSLAVVRLLGLPLLLLVLLSVAGNASELTEQIWAADAAAGEQVYSSSCITCHGSGGNSVVPEQPIIASQQPEYLADQMFQYRDGTRQNTVMQTFAQQLSDEDIYNVAAYLGSQRAGLSGVTDIQLANDGELIYLKGIAAKGVPNCTGCHGPAGKGIPPMYPRLSGQHAVYTATTLRELRSGERTNEVMNAIAANLSDEEIDALAQYISGLH